MVLASCSELMATRKYAAVLAAQCVASLMLGRAADALSPAPPGTSRSSSSTSSSALTAMFWEQLERSSFLQQLPSAFTLQASRMQASGAQHIDSASVFLHMPAFHLWGGLQRLQPSFLTDHVTGQQCIVPAMQLGLASLQYISKAASQGGRQDWMRDLLQLSCNAALDAATAAVSPLEYFFDEQEGSSSDGSSDSIEGVAADVLQAEETVS
jgi:hypothetical protein